MYEIMRELQPEIEILFESKACTETKEAAMNSAKRLAQTAQETFVDFEETVEKDATKTTVIDGTVHHLTNYVSNYVNYDDYHVENHVDYHVESHVDHHVIHVE
ncbi:hypothetical protein Fmac_032314 [Flemingia macrophylla]|uniref:Exocyst subunit Exo70 family protein n=1 Tax=Flemingia macrophylla TaxID=520843 RepID=A0ABD1L4Z6_9FABA